MSFNRPDSLRMEKEDRWLTRGSDHYLWVDTSREVFAVILSIGLAKSSKKRDSRGQALSLGGRTGRVRVAKVQGVHLETYY